MEGLVILMSIGTVLVMVLFWAISRFATPKQGDENEVTEPEYLQNRRNRAYQGK